MREGAKVYHLRFGVTTARQPGFEDRMLSPVVAGGFGQRPLMLLTTVPAGRARRRVWRMVESYLAPWRVEETTRVRPAADSSLGPELQLFPLGP